MVEASVGGSYKPVRARREAKGGWAVVIVVWRLAGGVGDGEGGFVAEEVSPRVDIVAEKEPARLGNHGRAMG
jgi:hypothetical protein